ncbi:MULTISPECIES: hypothetical protein [unclassified Carboxylicivirga]|uniref:hypothetical protein n=1 Tax=Carboxylicivirga TaxID=1628153 RepID=UPI003D342C78
MKIIRISPELHNDFKKLCIREKKGLTEGAELLINSALKKGTLKEVTKNVFNQIQGLESTFKSWMRQHEKSYFKNVSDDLIVLSRTLKDVSTRTQNEELFKNGIASIQEVADESHRKYEALLHQKAIERASLLSTLKKSAITLCIIAAVFVLSNFIIDFNIRLDNIQAENYDKLRTHCKMVQERHKGINILESFDQMLSQQNE